ncbi:Fic/DOC family protein [Lactococcus hircilactis]|uniref:Fic/DOC family protein n=1 Tax=Lactococcus hircilactis TaxID=1494462 RepID=UPI003FA1C5AA
MRKLYQGYAYQDPDNLYTYPNSSVLINRFNLTDADKAHEKEYQLTADRVIELARNPINVWTVKDILKIHGYLFQDMYDWAGQYRKVNISKQGNAFMAMQAFGSAETYMNSLLEDFHENVYNREEVIKGLAKILDNENYFHPFREGNGRTQREVIRSLAMSKGYKARINILEDDIYNLYMDGTVHSDITKLEQLFDKILMKIN